MATTRQKAVAKKIMESNGKKAVSKAMVEAGYSTETAKNPQQITRSKGWEELMEEYLPDELLQKVHREGLEATKIISANITYGDADEKTNDFIDVPDYPTRKQYLELGYKVKNKIKDKVEVSGDKDNPLAFTIVEDTHLKDINEIED